MRRKRRRILRLAEFQRKLRHRAQLPHEVDVQIDALELHHAVVAEAQRLVVHAAVVGAIPEAQAVLVAVAVPKPVVNVLFELFVVFAVEPAVVSRLPAAEQRCLREKGLEMVARLRVADAHRARDEAGLVLLVEEHLDVVAAEVGAAEVGKEQVFKVHVPVVQLVVRVARDDKPPVVEPDAFFADVRGERQKPLSEPLGRTAFVPVCRQQVFDFHVKSLPGFPMLYLCSAHTKSFRISTAILTFPIAIPTYLPPPAKRAGTGAPLAPIPALFNPVPA